VRRLLQSALIGGSCVIGAIVAAGSAATAATAATAAVKTVRYDRYALRVPAAWPVFRLASDPSACVRFDRHAVYLGRPSAEQRCPAHSVGRTEAILVEPLSRPTAATRSVAGNARMLPEASTAQARGSVGRLVVPARGVVVTATWATHPGTIERALGVRSIPAQPSGAAAARSSVMASSRQAPAGAGASSGARRFNTVNVGGLGFDTCSAPSLTAMSAWLQSSPFRAAGIYIGGANSACSQPNLSASWVTGVSAAGWQLIPVYVGLQAPGSSCGCAVIAAAQATAEGAAAASDAVAQAQALGIGPGNPIYFDMEAYKRTATTTSTVLAFLSAWTTQLIGAGYISGVYGSASSGITDFVNAVGTPFAEPADIWIADWNNQATASDPYVPAADWSSNQRLHQYRGGHIDKYGGVSLDIDTNYLDGATATAGPGVPTIGVGALPDGTFVSYLGKTYRLAGGAPVYVHSWSVYGGPQPTVQLVAAEWNALKPVPADGTFIRATTTGKVYRIAGGAPVYIPNWSAVAGPQPAVVVDRWDIQNISSALTHLRAAPANGTIVQGLPSGLYWQFTAGMRAPSAASSAAVSVDDLGLGSFLQWPTPSRVTLWGVASRKAKLRVTVTAGANAPALRALTVTLPSGLAFATLTRGLGVWSANGRPLASALALHRGVLTITLSAPARVVRIAAASPAVSATGALAAQVTARAVTRLQVVIVTTDTKHDRAVLTLDPGAS
jgi:hypothetical protein